MERHNAITLIIKPTNECNLRCSYCYHSERGYESDKMPMELFNDICLKTFPFFDNIKILWHGGEPLMMGLGFFESTMAIINQVKHDYHTQVGIALQTNGTLIDENWIDFFKKNDIKIGMSFDGKVNEQTRGDTKKLLSIFEMMRSRDMRVGVIHVLTKLNIEYILEDYEFYKNNRISVKFNPVFDNELHKAKRVINQSESYVYWLSRLFDYWAVDEKCEINVDPFIEYVHLVAGNAHSCEFSSCLTHWLSIDHRGEITPCGRNYSADYNLGNVSSFSDLYDAFKTTKYMDLIQKSITRRDDCKRNCCYFEYCRGGCTNTMILQNDASKSEGEWCDNFRGLFSYVKRSMQEIMVHHNAKTSLNPFLKSVLNAFK